MEEGKRELRGELNSRLHELARRYFPGWSEVSMWHVEARVDPRWVEDGPLAHAAGETYWDRKVIRIHPVLVDHGGHLLDALLVHELAHAVVGKEGHGPPWIQLMREAARRAGEIGETQFAQYLDFEVIHSGEPMDDEAMGLLRGGLPLQWSTSFDAVIEYLYESASYLTLDPDDRDPAAEEAFIERVEALERHSQAHAAFETLVAQRVINELAGLVSWEGVTEEEDALLALAEQLDTSPDELCKWAPWLVPALMNLAVQGRVCQYDRERRWEHEG